MQKAAVSPYLLPVGYRLEDAAVCTVDIRRTPCYLITGERKGGKKNFLELLLREAILKGGKIFLLAGDERRFREYADKKEVSCAFGEEQIAACLENEIMTLPELWRSAPEGEDGPAENTVPVYIFITDLCSLLQMAYRSGGKMHDALETLFGKASENSCFIAAVLELDMKSQIQAYKAFRLFTAGKTGIHFGGKTINNTLMSFEHLDYREQNRSEKPGTGLLPAANKGDGTGKIIVPLCGGEI